MKLKEIKPGMAIHCTSREQVQYLVDIGVVNESLTKYDVPIWIHVIGNGICWWMPDVDKNGMKGKDFYEKDGCHCVEFSDLIISEPELSAEEALLAYDQMCNENYCCSDCPIYEILGRECTHEMDGHITEIVDAIKKWKSDHEKKEPEIETVDICRIIEIQPNGFKRCVHEEDIKSELPFGCDERQKVEEILKRYCMEHDGEYIAVHEVVSRVKAVE